MEIVYSVSKYLRRLMMRVGLIVNPIAGMGGRVGLKGTDNMLSEALRRGAQPIAPKRAIEFLDRLEDYQQETKIEFVTAPGVMGETEAETRFSIQVLPMQIARVTSAEDTMRAVRMMNHASVDLLVFVGGDGTARDIFNAFQDHNETPVLGVPSGVKMYSGIFAISPADAADVVLAFARKEAQLADFEIIDTDENAVRKDSFDLRLLGLLNGPFIPAHIQGSKQISPETVGEVENQKAIAKFIVESLPSDDVWILGPGTTVEHVARALGLEKTVLGVDVYKEGKLLRDLDEKEILSKVDDWTNTWIIVSPIGHQGIIFGRGNQQISPEIIERVGKGHVIVLATKSKIQNMEEKVLRVDTGNVETDNMLKGYIRVVTDYREWRVMPVR
jgi:predicted polyphosphate/ATP-dependent NAD kinase